MATKKLRVYKIRWREQAQAYEQAPAYEETLIKAHTEREALEKLANKAILAGIGKYYLWVIWIMDCSEHQCMLTKRLYIKRMSEILD